MENLHVEIPVSVGDTLYRTNSKCEIEQGVVTKIELMLNITELTVHKRASNRK